jgi:membrane-associated phospholipid phosphatase
VTVPPDDDAVATRTHSLRGTVTGIVVGVVVLVLLGLGVLTGFGPQQEVDDAVGDALYAGDDRSVALDWLLRVLTAPGSATFRLVVFLPVIIWLLRRGARWTAAWVLTVNLTIGPLTTLLKELTGRVRPAFEQGGARLDSLSYPSGHSSGIATMVTVALVLAWPRLATTAARRLWLVVGIAVVVVVGCSRIWLGVHYLSDVVGGWALGVAWTLFTALLFGAFAGGRSALPQKEPV